MKISPEFWYDGVLKVIVPIVGTVAAVIYFAETGRTETYLSEVELRESKKAALVEITKGQTETTRVEDDNNHLLYRREVMGYPVMCGDREHGFERRLDVVVEGMRRGNQGGIWEKYVVLGSDGNVVMVGGIIESLGFIEEDQEVCVSDS